MPGFGELDRLTPKEPNWFQRFFDLSEAVRDLYGAAHWTPDRDCDATKLWEAVRDAAGMPPGTAPKPRS